MSSLKECMDREVKSKVDEFGNAMSTYNLLSLWRITEEVCVGRGAVSIHLSVNILFSTSQADWAGLHVSSEQNKTS